jgi:hydrogenase maturation protein HypF
MAENDLDGELLGVAWDGTGYGTDGTIWGGEFFVLRDGTFVRAAYVRQFPLPGGDAAIKEPRRTALGILYEMMGESAFEQTGIASVAAFSPAERTLLRRALRQHINAPLTSSVGRLFDAVASLIGLRQHVRHEGQAAMELEFALADLQTDEAYPFEVRSASEDGRSVLVIDWEPMIRRVLDDVNAGTTGALIAARFHNMLVETVVTIAQRMALPRVVLSGGCFQNKYLSEHLIARLQRMGFRPYWHQRVPPNDGGIALGQAYAMLLQRGAATRVADLVEYPGDRWSVH